MISLGLLSRADLPEANIPFLVKLTGRCQTFLAKKLTIFTSPDLHFGREWELVIWKMDQDSEDP